MKTISREELKNRLDRREPVQLVMALGRWDYEAMHIPGSVLLDNLSNLNRAQEVIVYDTNPACPASYRAYYLLMSLGFTNVRRFPGGIEEWLEAGYPIEGNAVNENV